MTYAAPAIGAVHFPSLAAAYTAPSINNIPLSLQPQFLGNLAYGFVAKGFGGNGSASFQVGAKGFASSSFGVGEARIARMATGFKIVVFGTALLPGVYQAAGAKAVKFGAPSAPRIARGFAPVAFGVPSTPLLASGWHAPASFGGASARQSWRHYQAFPWSMFGAPSIAAPLVGSASGWRSAKFGGAIAFQFTTDHAQSAVAKGFPAAAFGVPSVPVLSVVRASGAKHPRFGTSPSASTATFGVISRFGMPRSVLRLPGHGHALAVFGAAAVARGGNAQGARHTFFGLASVARAAYAQGAQQTRFGICAIKRQGDVQQKSSHPTTRFGGPTALRRFNYPASGWSSPGFGVPSCATASNARGAPPASRFGTALVKRTGIC